MRLTERSLSPIISAALSYTWMAVLKRDSGKVEGVLGGGGKVMSTVIAVRQHEGYKVLAKSLPYFAWR